MYIIPVSANSNTRRRFSYMLLLIASYLLHPHLSRTHWLVFFCTSAGVCPADCPQLFTSEYAVFLAASYAYTLFHQKIYIKLCAWSQLVHIPSAPMAQLPPTLTLHMSCILSYMAAYHGMNVPVSFIRFYFLKKCIWLCEKQYLITVNLTCIMTYFSWDYCLCKTQALGQHWRICWSQSLFRSI